MSEFDKKIIWLREERKLSYRKIAKELGLSTAERSRQRYIKAVRNAKADRGAEALTNEEDSRRIE